MHIEFWQLIASTKLLAWPGAKNRIEIPAQTLPRQLKRNQMQSCSR